MMLIRLEHRVTGAGAAVARPGWTSLHQLRFRACAQALQKQGSAAAKQAADGSEAPSSQVGEPHFGGDWAPDAGRQATRQWRVTEDATIRRSHSSGGCRVTPSGNSTEQALLRRAIIAPGRIASGIGSVPRSQKSRSRVEFSRGQIAGTRGRHKIHTGNELVHVVRVSTTETCGSTSIQSAELIWCI